jgi:hypothetical protein
MDPGMRGMYEGMGNSLHTPGSCAVARFAASGRCPPRCPNPARPCCRSRPLPPSASSAAGGGRGSEGTAWTGQLRLAKGEGDSIVVTYDTAGPSEGVCKGTIVVIGTSAAIDPYASREVDWEGLSTPTTSELGAQALYCFACFLDATNEFPLALPRRVVSSNVHSAYQSDGAEAVRRATWSKMASWTALPGTAHLESPGLPAGRHPPGASGRQHGNL